MEQKQFQAESKRMLDLMIHSIYTHKEIFLRELISNASDAIDKLYFRSMNEDGSGKNRDEYYIELRPDKEKRTLTIIDNGIGMTAEELEQNLGVIAHSGSLSFKTENTLDENTDIIGQFGVGFYSAFMIAKRVTVRTKAYGSDTAYVWQSEGADGYTIDTCDKNSVGTEIELELLADTEDEKYSEFLEEFRIRQLVKKYSDYIRFPIRMEVSREKLKEGSESEYETHIEVETLNSMTPIWKKNKNELTDDDYNNFYRDKFFDYSGAPLLHIHSRSEGTVTYNSLLYIPAKAPFDYYSKDYEKGLQLFASGVMIMEKCPDLLPDHFSFVRGLVDSEDLSLNISREMLQHDRQLKLISKSLEKSIKNELVKLLKTDRDKYIEFWKAFGIQLKFGIYNEFGQHKELLQDLLMFHSSGCDTPEGYTTLAEYVTRMREDQKYIYYAAGETVTRCAGLPAAELVRDKGYEVLYLTDNVDEFAIQMLQKYQDKEFKNISAGDLGLESEEDKTALDEKNAAAKDLFAEMEKALAGKVKAVRLSNRLKSHAVCLSSDGDLSLEMEKVLNTMPSGKKVQAERVLELNPEHPVFAKLEALLNDDKEKLTQYAELLYQQALLIEGIPVEDPVALSKMICDLMV
ncbi:MAG: molecular chaperone HtpG [Oscillospiraceae bacterium]|nr:molecular chaperone HtpG [Oscillospiraceae bacterium]